MNATATTADLGHAIHSHLEGKDFEIGREQNVRAEVIDTLDPDNLIIMLDNGQRFVVRIFSIG